SIRSGSAALIFTTHARSLSSLRKLAAGTTTSRSAWFEPRPPNLTIRQSAGRRSQDRLRLDEQMIGRVIGTYKIVEKLGEGGMGAVYKGIDTMLDREVAIKALKPELASQTAIVERFRKE